MSNKAAMSLAAALIMTPVSRLYSIGSRRYKWGEIEVQPAKGERISEA
jgi:hypothetical protein